jgi:hypothetical protein
MGTSPAPAPDFGNAGKVTVRTDVNVTSLHVANGEFLDYSLTTNAPAPAFGFACQHRKWLTSADFPVQANYTWTHFQKTGEEDAPDDSYSITMLFLGAPASYTLKVIKRDKGGNALQTLKDLDFSSTDPTDFTTSTLEVVAV